MNSTYRVHNISVHMRWCMQEYMCIDVFMHLCRSYVKSPVSWLANCTCMYVRVKVQLDVHRALCSSALMSGYFPPGWLYDVPALIYVHIRWYDSVLTTLGYGVKCRSSGYWVKLKPTKVTACEKLSVGLLEVEPTFLARVHEATWWNADVEMQKLGCRAHASHA